MKGYLLMYQTEELSYLIAPFDDFEQALNWKKFLVSTLKEYKEEELVIQQKN